MSRTNSAHHYGSVTKTFHWLTALLILTLIPLGIIANKLPYETSEQLAQKAWLFSLHKTLGVTVFFVALARIALGRDANQTRRIASRPQSRKLAGGNRALAALWLAFVGAAVGMDTPCVYNGVRANLVAVWAKLAIGCEIRRHRGALCRAAYRV